MVIRQLYLPCRSRPFQGAICRGGYGEEKSELDVLESAVRQSMEDHALLAKNINIEFDRQLSFGDRLSDRIADFAGSWTFILSFTGVMFLWIILNTFILMTGPFDPYPYILLNLVLSAVAAIQAPSLS